MRWNSPPIASARRFDRHRLGQARHAFDENMPARQQRDDQSLQQVVLPDDDLFDLVKHAFHRFVAARVAGLVHMFFLYSAVHGRTAQ